MTLTVDDLARLGVTVTAALASGRHDALTVEEVLQHAGGRDLCAWLETRLGPDGDLAWLSVEGRTELDQEWHRMAHALVLETVGLDRAELVAAWASSWR
jgi:hypothetical protein